MKVYLAGKIREHEKDWRRPVLCERETFARQDDAGGPAHWPERWAPVDATDPALDGVQITGPFFLGGEGHDGMHTASGHGVAQYYGERDNDESAAMPTRRRQQIAQLCRAAITDSDFCLRLVRYVPCRRPANRLRNPGRTGPGRGSG